MTREEELKELKYSEGKSVVMIGERRGIWVRCECSPRNKRIYVYKRFQCCPRCGKKLDKGILDD